MIATFSLGRPLPANRRGGDCSVADLDEERYVGGTHRFADTAACRISNGLIRVTVGASGVAPVLAVEACHGPVVIDDFYTDTYTDIYPGSLSTRNWLDMGTVTIDSAALSALLTQVRILALCDEFVTLRLVAPLMADAYVTLRRGQRAITVHHGYQGLPRVSTARRVRWTASPSLVGAATGSRVEESSPAVDGFPRFIGTTTFASSVSAGAFSITTGATVHAKFAVGIATDAPRDTTADLHAQLGDSSVGELVLA
jgi:hypothetical protein